VQALVLTPQGEILHVISGYISPQSLLEELTIALKNFGAISKTPHDRRMVLGDRIATRRDDVAKRTFEGPLNDWAKRSALRDLDYTAKHPLQAYTTFRPTDLTGNGKTFFGSSRGAKPKGRIGETPGNVPGLTGGGDLPGSLRKQLKEQMDGQLTDKQRKALEEQLGELLK
jgi:hypothetical protein